MLRAFFACLIAAGLAPVARSADDESYTIKFYHSKKGDRSEHEHSETAETKVLVSVGGTDQKEEHTTGKKEVYTQELLEKKDGARLATKLTRTYTVAEKTEKGETTKTAYAGETVLIEKMGDKYEFRVKGQALEERAAPELFREFSRKKEDGPRNEDFLPDGPVKVGASWTVPGDRSAKMFESLGQGQMKLDTKKSTIGGKLLKVYTRDGARFGVMELTITGFVTQFQSGGRLVKTTDGSKIVLKGTLDTCIDGTVAFEDGKVETTIDIAAELPNAVSVKITGKTTGIDKERAAKK